MFVKQYDTLFQKDIGEKQFLEIYFQTSDQGQIIKQNELCLTSFSKMINSIKSVIYYFLIPFDCLRSNFSNVLYEDQEYVDHFYRKPLSKIEIIIKKDPLKDLLEIVKVEIAQPREFTILTIIKQVITYYRSHKQQNDYILNCIGDIISLYYCLDYTDKATLISNGVKQGTTEIQLKFIVPKEKPQSYKNNFEQFYINSVDKLFNQQQKLSTSYQFIPTMGYMDSVQYFIDCFNFENNFTQRAFRFSQQLMEDSLQNLLINYDFIVSNQLALKALLETMNYHNLVLAFEIISYDKDYIREFGRLFEEFIKSKSISNYQELSSLLKQINFTIELLVSKRFRNLSIYRSELMSSRDRGFNQIIMIDIIIKQEKHDLEELTYFLSVCNGRQQFLEGFKKNICSRLLESGFRNFNDDLLIFQTLKKSINIDQKIQKIFQDGDLSQKLTFELQKSHPECSVILIDEGTFLRDSNWELPQKAKNEWYKRKQTPIKKQVLRRSSRSKKIEIESKNQLSTYSPQYVQDIFVKCQKSLQIINKDRFVSQLLFSMGVAEVLYHAYQRDYYLQVSTCQLVLLLQLEERKGYIDKSMSLTELIDVVQCDVSDDIQSLVNIGIIVKKEDNKLCLNYKFEHKDSQQIKCRPVQAKYQKSEKQETVVELQKLIEVYAVKIMKQGKSAFIKDLIEEIWQKMSNVRQPTKCNINLQIQQMITSGQYIQLDEKDSLKVNYV